MSDRYGAFSLQTLNQAEKDTLAQFFQRSLNSPAVEFLRYFLGDDYVTFMDILAGTSLKIPSHKSLEHDIQNVRIYSYVFRHDFTADSIKRAGKLFSVSLNQSRRAVERVSRVLGVEDWLEGEALSNFQINVFCSYADREAKLSNTAPAPPYIPDESFDEDSDTDEKGSESEMGFDDTADTFDDFDSQDNTCFADSLSYGDDEETVDIFSFLGYDEESV